VSLASADVAGVTCSLGTVKGLIRDLTTGGTLGVGRTGELAQRAAVVSCVTREYRPGGDCDPEVVVRNARRSRDLKPVDCDEFWPLLVEVFPAPIRSLVPSSGSLPHRP